jgi:serralysin
MATYTNPTGTFNATDGDDTIIFNTAPSGTASIDALGGNDSLLVQFDNTSPISFDVSDEFNAGFFDVDFRANPFTPVYVLHVEHVDLHGTANNDTFRLQIGPSSSALTVNMDGGAGQDLLRLFASTMTTGISFVVNGSSITSSFGTFSNFETFDIRAGSGDDTITTGSGDDAVETGTGVDHVSTGAGNDSIYIESAGGLFDAGDGNDWVSWTVGSSSSGFTVDGGAGQDQLHLDWTSATAGQSLVVNGSTFTSSLGSFAGFETFYISAGSGDDTITTGSGDDNIYGGGGNDTISAGDGNNNVSAGDGNDAITAGFGNDMLHGDHGDDNIAGGDGADTIYGDENVFSTIGDGNDHIDGGAGSDTVYGGGGGDTINGGAGNDFLVGGKGADHIDGGDGNDNIAGFGEDSYGPDDNLPDVLIGGAGDDVIQAGYGDSVDGGAGTDQLYFNAFAGMAGINADFSQLTGGGSITVGGATISGIEYVNLIGGTNYNDTIIAGATTASGGLQLSGYGGDDILTGSSGHDLIDGGEGDDVLIGGLGADSLTGGNGTDTYRGTAAELNGDTISRLDPGERIVITNANLNNFSFSYDGNGLFFTGGSLTIGSGGNVPGRLVASAAPEGGVQITIQPLPVATVDQIANQLTSGYWNGDTHHWAVSQGGNLTVNISTLNAAEQTLARAALAEWTDIIGVHFQEVSSGGQIIFDHTEDPSGPIAATDSNWANGIISSAHIQISSSWVNAYGTSLNSYSFQTYVHEIGHALGLGHSGNYNVDARYQTGALFADDGWPLTIMSYFDQQENRYFSNQGFSFNYVLTPMQADILAAQNLYGSSTTTRTGDTVYGFHSNAGTIYDASAFPSAEFTIFDSGGNDTLDYSGFSGFQKIDLNSEAFSQVNGYTGNVSIARGALIENAIGGNGIDIIIGNSAANVLTGNLGADTLTGGAGADTFKDSAAGLNGDTIVDFSDGDKIVITNATLAGFSFSLSGNTLTYTGGSLTLGSVPVGHIVASAAAGGGVQLTVEVSDVHNVNGDSHNDFNGDGLGDILWRDDNGLLFDWLGTANGGFTSNASNFAINVGTEWRVLGTGDFNDDGRDDILWRQDGSGHMLDWLGTANGGFISNSGNFDINVSTEWQVAGTGDFNGDGRDDILWRQDGTGRLLDWLGTANGGFISNSGNIDINVSTEWRIAGTGDFNGDGRDDILWRQGGTGRLLDWLGTANGGFTSNSGNFDMNVGTEWRITGTGDFNGDGRDDILWRQNGSGHLLDWLGTANGGFISNAAHFDTFVPTAPHVQDSLF